jgi:predicted neuraminidase
MNISHRCKYIAVMIGAAIISGLVKAEGKQAERPAFLEPPQVISTSPGPEYQIASRKFQGIPSLARSRKGRLWAVWYASGSGGEDQNNYVVAVTSGDDGRTWSDTVLVIDPDGKGPVRAFDPQAWLDPDGRLWLFWAQAIGHDGTVAGVWAITTENPDDRNPRWSQPRRLTDGVMMGKPLVLSSGEWLLPASTWRKTDHSARAVVSTDRGKTWQVRGGCQIPPAMRAFDEHLFVERKDGSLWLLARSNTGFLLESVSRDRGKTWPVARPSAIKHPSARFFIRRLASGKLLLVKHHNTTGRKRLTALLSSDEGATWCDGLVLDERGTISYPDGVQAKDGRIFIIYDRNRTRDRQILLAVFTEQAVAAGRPGKKTRLKVLVSQGGPGR